MCVKENWKKEFLNFKQKDKEIEKRNSFHGHHNLWLACNPYLQQFSACCEC